MAWGQASLPTADLKVKRGSLLVICVHLWINIDEYELFVACLLLLDVSLRSKCGWLFKSASFSTHCSIPGYHMGRLIHSLGCDESEFNSSTECQPSPSVCSV